LNVATLLTNKYNIHIY